MIHCPPALSPQLSRMIWMTIRSVVNFPVPVFFFLAGYFAWSSYSKFSSGLSYIVQRGWRLIVPYTIWSFFYLAFSSDKSSCGLILAQYFTGRTVTPFYFIVVLFQLTLVTPLLMELDRRKSKLLYVAYSLQFVMLALTYIIVLTANSVPYYWRSLPFFGVGFYVLGIQLRSLNDSNDNSSNAENIRREYSSGIFVRVFTSPFFLLAAFLINWLESYLMLKNNISLSFAVSQSRIGGILYSYALIFTIYRYRHIDLRNFLKRILVPVGGISYGIFYVHIKAISVGSRLFSRVFPNSPWLITYVSVLIFALSLSILFITGTRMILRGEKGKLLLRAVGF